MDRWQPVRNVLREQPGICLRHVIQRDPRGELFPEGGLATAGCRSRQSQAFAGELLELDSDQHRHGRRTPWRARQRCTPDPQRAPSSAGPRGRGSLRRHARQGPALRRRRDCSRALGADEAGGRVLPASLSTCRAQHPSHSKSANRSSKRTRRTR